MVGRPQNPIRPEDGPVAAFALDLRALRLSAGNAPYRKMAQTAHYSAPALSLAASGKKFPTWECTRAYLRGCGVGDESEIKQWKKRWQQVYDFTRSPQNPAGHDQKAQPVPAVAAGPVVPPTQRTPNASAEDASTIDLRTVTSTEDFITELDRLRTSQRLTLRELSTLSRDVAGSDAETGRVLPPTTIHDVLRRRTIQPTTNFISAFVMACGYSKAQADLWVRTYQRLRVEETRAQAALDALKDTVAPPERTYHDLMPAELPDAEDQAIEITQPVDRPVAWRGTHRERNIARWQVSPRAAVLVCVIVALATLVAAFLAGRSL